MLTKDLTNENAQALPITLESFILNENDYTISNKALFTGFQYRSKVEFLKFFIV